MVPSVQAKLLARLALRLILGDVPLQMLAVVVVVTLGNGFTVNVPAVLVAGEPHAPLTTHSYKLPLSAVVAPVRFSVDAVAPVILLYVVPPSVLSIHW